MSLAKGLAAQQQHQHQRNTMTKYFPVLQDGASSRGSEQALQGQALPGQAGRGRSEAVTSPLTAEAACQTELAQCAAEQARVQALQAELEQLRSEAAQLRCPKYLLGPSSFCDVIREWRSP